MADIEKKDLENETASAPAEKAKKEDKPAKAKSDKPSVPSRMAAWFRSCKAEMKKVVWASPKSVLHNSVMVIVVIAVVAVAVALLDFVFTQGITGLNSII